MILTSSTFGKRVTKPNSINMKYLIPRSYAVLTVPRSNTKYTDYNWVKGDFCDLDGKVDKDNQMLFFANDNWRIYEC